MHYFLRNTRKHDVLCFSAHEAKQARAAREAKSKLAAQKANEELKNLSEEYTTLVSQLKGQVADEGQKVALEADLTSTRQALEEAQSALEVNIKSNKENVDKLQHELMDSHMLWPGNAPSPAIVHA